MNQQQNLKSVESSIYKIISIFLTVSFTIFTILFLYSYYENKEQNEEYFKFKLRLANTTLQDNIADQISLIFNDQFIVNYLFSGQYTRLKYHDDIVTSFDNLSNGVIIGVKILKISLNNQPELIFDYGGKSDLYVKLDICYLNNRIDIDNGDCLFKHFHVVIYFNYYLYINELHKIDTRLEADTPKTPSYDFNPFENYFSTLKIESSSNTPIKLAITYNDRLNNFIFTIIIILIVLLVLTYIISHKLLRNIIEKNLVSPIRDLMALLNGNVIARENKEYIAELSQLLEVVNSYTKQQTHEQLTKIVARVAHDIRSPLSIIELCVKRNFNNIGNSDHVAIIKNATSQARAIVDNMLYHYSSINRKEKIIKEGSVYVMIRDVFEEIINQKKIEWSAFNINVIINFNDISNNITWIHISPYEFRFCCKVILPVNSLINQRFIY